MAVTRTPIRGNFRITNMQDEVIQSYQRFRHDISAVQAEQILEAVALLRGHPVGNGYLTVTNELAEA
jgi:hypothetical protein